MNGKMYIRMLGLGVVLFASQVHAATQHLVEPNETLSSIATRYGVTQTALINLNGMSTTHIKVGDILQIPDPKLSQQYVVKSGDSLTKVAQEFGVSVVQLAQANNLNPQAEIQIGNRLTIPPIQNSPSVNNNNTTTNQIAAVSRQSTAQNVSAASTNTANSRLNSTLTNNINNNQNNGLNADGKYRVQYGENLTLIAKKYDIPVVKLAQFNNMSLNDELHFGRMLTIPTKQQLNSMSINTNTTSSNSANNSAASRPSSYRVKKGDTLIDVANKYGIEFRELARFNNMNYYDHLIVGQQLKLPTPDASASNSNNSNNP